MIVVGEGSLRYEVVENWLKVPEGWEHKDVAGIATDSQDRVYLFTRSEHPVVVYSPDGDFLSTWGEDIFTRAHGITIVDDIAYLADVDDHTVRKCTLDGKVLMTLGTPHQPSDTGYIQHVPANLTTIKRAAGPFNRPAKAAIAPNGEIFVGDGYGNARIHRFSPDGELMLSWGEPGGEPGQLNCPHSLWVHRDGRVIVCDRDNDRVQIFSPDGELLEIWPDIPRVSDIYVDQEDRVFLGELLWKKGLLSMAGRIIPEDRPSQVSIRNLNGEVLTHWGGFDRFAPGNFASAHSLCVDSKGAIYVAEVTFTALSPRVTGDNSNLYRRDLKLVQKFVPV